MQVNDSRGAFVRVMDGSARGPLPGVLRALLMPAGWVYGSVVRLRRNAYRSGFLKSFPAGAHVISVGNLTVGGTGKTPMVEWIARHLVERGRRPAILSRGYGAGPAERNDEALLLDQNVPGVAHYSIPDRVAGGREAVANGADCLVLDDGFQHMRIRRDLNLVLLDSLAGFGNGRVLPAGPLREPAACLRDAHALVLTRTDAAAPERITALRQRVEAFAPNLEVLEAMHKPVALTDAAGADNAPPERLRGARVFLFCGIGNPGAFLRTVEQLGAQVAGARFLPDHFPYDAATLTALAEDSGKSGAEFALATEKDAMKIGARWPGPIPLRVLRIQFEFRSGPARMDQMLEDALKR